MRDSRILMDDLIERQINTIRDDIPIGTPERTDAINQLETMYRVRAEDSKNINQRNLQILTVASTLIGLGIQVVAYNYWFKQACMFEKTDTFTGSAQRNLMGSILRPFNFRK